MTALGQLDLFVLLVGPPTAIIVGHIARWRIRRARGRLSGGKLALAGLILGYLALVDLVYLLYYLLHFSY